MKFYFIILFLFSIISCSQHKDRDGLRNFVLDTSAVFSLDLDSVRQQDSLTCTFYADSLNAWTAGILPKFLERDLEDEHPSFSEDFHHLRSFRMAFFEKVYNKEVIKAILNSDNEFYSKQWQESRVPYSSLTMKEVAKIRYEELVKK